MDAPEVASGPGGGEVPLVVDLDGTLFDGDLLVETALSWVRQHPWQVFRLLVWWREGGRSRLKAQLASRVDFSPEALLYNEPLLAWLKEQRSQGRTLLLATGSHRLLAEAVAAHLGCFDAVLATEEGTNLTGPRKASALVARYGEGGFDYIGNERTDVPVWRVARIAHVVTSSPALVGAVGALGNLGRQFEPRRTRTSGHG